MKVKSAKVSKKRGDVQVVKSPRVKKSIFEELLRRAIGKDAKRD